VRFAVYLVAKLSSLLSRQAKETEEIVDLGGRLVREKRDIHVTPGLNTGRTIMRFHTFPGFLYPQFIHIRGIILSAGSTAGKKIAIGLYHSEKAAGLTWYRLETIRELVFEQPIGPVRKRPLPEITHYIGTKYHPGIRPGYRGIKNRSNSRVSRGFRSYLGSSIRLV